jgi:hypothetical protein
MGLIFNKRHPNKIHKGKDFPALRNHLHLRLQSLLFRLTGLERRMSDSLIKYRFAFVSITAETAGIPTVIRVVDFPVHLTAPYREDAQVFHIINSLSS